MVYTDQQGAEMKAEFLSLLRQVQRPGMDNLIEWMETKTDFFVAPASSKFHGCFKYGLVRHSLNVYYAALKLVDMARELGLQEKNIDQTVPSQSLILCCLLHDICKINQYKETVKFFKDDTNSWQKYISYEIEKQIPLGHGSASCAILQTMIQLNMNELAAIMWHMGMTDVGLMMSPYTKTDLMQSMNDIPLVQIVAQADYFASFMMEKEIDQKVVNRII